MKYTEHLPVKGNMVVAIFKNEITGEVTNRIKAKDARTDCCDAPVEWYYPDKNMKRRWLVCSDCHYAIKNSVVPIDCKGSHDQD